MNKKKFSFDNYYSSFLDLIKPNKEIVHKINFFCNLIKKTNRQKSKILFFGNGGSAAIASHVAIDLTKNAKMQSLCFNDSSHITCLANDYGYENWIQKSIEFYCNKNDLVVLISSSGASPNMIKAAKFCIQKKIKLVTFTGKSSRNKLKLLNLKGLNFWVNSYAYNHIELTHLFWLLSSVDTIIGKFKYKVN